MARSRIAIVALCPGILQRRTSVPSSRENRDASPALHLRDLLTEIRENTTNSHSRRTTEEHRRTLTSRVSPLLCYPVRWEGAVMNPLLPLVFFTAFWASVLFYLHRSTKLSREIRDELSKLNAKR
jgi:hypothetical protein